MSRGVAPLAYEGLKEGLHVIVRCTDAIPVVKSATQGFLEIIERYDVCNIYFSLYAGGLRYLFDRLLLESLPNSLILRTNSMLLPQFCRRMVF